MMQATPSRIRGRIFEFPGVPIPEGKKSGTVTTSDGFQLRYARWPTAVRPSRGTIIVLQGRAEFIEKYFETVEDLRQRGFEVLTFDWRGQGGSQRLLDDPEKGHIDHFNQYLDDLEAILSQIVLPDCRPPHYILAHSTGALVSLLAAPVLGNRIRRMVLISPLLKMNNLPVPQDYLRRLTGLLSFCGLSQAYVDFSGKSPANRSFIGNKVTSDTERFAWVVEFQQAHPELFLSAPTIGWTFSACRAMAQVAEPEHYNAIAIPSLLIAAGGDQVVSPQAISEMGEAMRSGAHLTVFGARHELLQERDVFREQVLAAFDAFVPGTEV